MSRKRIVIMAITISLVLIASLLLAACSPSQPAAPANPGTNTPAPAPQPEKTYEWKFQGHIPESVPPAGENINTLLRMIEENTGGRTDNRKHEKHREQVEYFEDDPEATEQQLEIGAIIIGTESPGELEGHSQNHRPQYGGDPHHPEKPAKGAIIEKILDDFTPGPITAGDNNRLENETGKQIFSEQ